MVRTIQPEAPSAAVQNTIRVGRRPMRPDDTLPLTAPADYRGHSQRRPISLPARLASQARRAVRQENAASVSAYIASAITEKAKLDDLAALLDDMLAESGGPLTPAEVRAADRALGAGSKRSRRR